MYIRSFFRKLAVELTVSIVAELGNEVYLVDLVEAFS